MPWFEKDGVRAEPTCRAQRHRRVDAVFSGLVARRGNDTPLIGLPADHHRFAAKFGPVEKFHRNKECIHVDVQDEAETCIRGGRGDPPRSRCLARKVASFGIAVRATIHPGEYEAKEKPTTNTPHTSHAPAPKNSHATIGTRSTCRGKARSTIDDSARKFIEAQPVFFVSTAPLESDGHLNISPKGLDTLRILGPPTVAYLDLTGSGIETISHLKQNGRIVLMFCAFQGPPHILRLHGCGTVVETGQKEFAEFAAHFPERREHGRLFRSKSHGFLIPAGMPSRCCVMKASAINCPGGRANSVLKL